MPVFTRKLTIPATVGKFSIEFSLLTYFNQEQNRYAYKLEGYDQEWHYGDASQHSAQYKDLPPGSYTFNLKASDSFGHWQQLPYGIKVKVLPPWYLSWWAFTLYIINWQEWCLPASNGTRTTLKRKTDCRCRWCLPTLPTNCSHR